MYQCVNELWKMSNFHSDLSLKLFPGEVHDFSGEHRRRKIDKWGGGDHIHIFVFCIINLFWNRLFLRSVNTNIWIWSPPHFSIFRRICRGGEKILWGCAKVHRGGAKRSQGRCAPPHTSPQNPAMLLPNNRWVTSSQVFHHYQNQSVYNCFI
jgi:hypothetical protein